MAEFADLKSGEGATAVTPVGVAPGIHCMTAERQQARSEVGPLLDNSFSNAEELVPAPSTFHTTDRHSRHRTDRQQSASASARGQTAGP